jgi:hypothetical protein
LAPSGEIFGGVSKRREEKDTKIGVDPECNVDESSMPAALML